MTPAEPPPPLALVETPPPRRWRKRALVGCLLLLGVFLLTGSVLWAMIVAAANTPEEPHHQVFSHPLPAGSGTIEIDARFADLEIEPGPPGSPLRLEASWDEARYHLNESLRPEGDAWRYELRFRGHGLRLVEIDGDHGAVLGGNVLRLTVPRDRSVALVGRYGLGESVLELGGLSLSSVDLRFGMGDHEVNFSEPTTQPLSLLRVEGTLGEITLDHAGNASPRRLALKHGMGDLVLDLTGQWRNDGDVELHLGMGDAEVHLPLADQAGAIVERAHVGLGDGEVHDRPISALTPGVPRVRIRATGGMGDLRIQ
jgi:hypothetical protein